ncbi:ribonuclease H-like domain-containing protein [Aspergillus venezuelensis]
MSGAEGPPRGGRGNDRGRGRGRGRGSSGGFRGFHGDQEDRGQFQGDLPYRNRGDRGGGGRGRGGRDQGPPIYSPKGGFSAPNAKVTQTENALEKALVKERSVGYPERPGYGTQGRPVTLFANYIEMMSVGKGLFRYNIGIDNGSNPSPPPKKLEQIINLMLEEHFSQTRRSIVTDFRSTMISHLQVLDEGQESATFDIVYRGEFEDAPPQTQERFRVSCKYTGRFDPADLLNYLTSTNAAAMFNEKAEVLQALNILIGHYPKTAASIASHGANKHYAIGQDAERQNLGAGLEALRGYFVSVRAATARLLVNVQVKYVACYEEGPLYQTIATLKAEKKGDPQSLKKYLHKLRVRVTHIERKNKKGQVIPRIKTIHGIATPFDGRNLANPPRVRQLAAGPKDVEFFLDAPDQSAPQASSAGSKGKKGKKGKKPAGPQPSGQYISVADFFKRNYNLNVNPELPVVNVGNSAQPSYLPVDVCMVEPGQPTKSKLTPDQTRDMLSFAVRNPGANARSIVEQGQKTLGIGASANPTLVDFGVQTNPSLITVPGRVLNSPNVYYNNNKPVAPIAGSWNMKSIRFSTTTKLQSWAYLYLHDPGSKPVFSTPKDLSDCLKAFAAKLREVGVMANSPITGSRIVLDSNYAGKINAEISDLMIKHKPQMILTILPKNDTGLYNCIKQACDIRHGVRNINVLASQLAKGNPQYFANVGLKFNLKLGGINQKIMPNQLGIIGEGKTMLLGIDVTHPSPGSAKEAPSVAAMVASVDSYLGQWPAEIRIQRESRTEMVDDLESMLRAHLRRWAKNYKGAYPENLIVYRDGVSEGQYDLVIEKELPLLQSACKAMYPATDTAKKLPRISIIIVGKRHHTRFYPTGQQDADRFNNPINGTVVDRGVTEARNWDFFLQAHTALQGTARPAHYYTVWDEIFVKQKDAADKLESMTHHMCYLFGRATKAVSICPPAYYADLVCTRARCYLSHAFDPSTPSGSVISDDSASVRIEAEDMRIHPNVADTMFYI